MYQTNIEQKHWYDGLRSMYDSTKGLVQKVSDKVLLGAISLDMMLGSPVAHAHETSEYSNSTSNTRATVNTCLGLMFVSLAPRQESRMRKVSYYTAGSLFLAAALLDAFAK